MSMMLLTGYTAKADSKEIPSMEFLEFLGEGIQVEGEYLDPVNYQEIGSDDKKEPVNEQNQQEENGHE